MNQHLASEKPALAVAVSGGADSMSLALLVQAWGGSPFTALIVDHGLRLESASEAQTVKGWLENKNIKAHILKGEAMEKGAGMQERARDYRYRLLIDWCHANNVRHLLIGHHADDQRETMLMRFIRASGVDGLGGIKPISEREGVMLMRPLLGIAKRELIEYLKEEKQPWVEDPTNDNDAYTRTRLRTMNEALGAEGLSPGRLDLIQQNLSRTSSYLAEQTVNFLNENGELSAIGFARINLAKFRAAHEEIRLRVLKKIIFYVSGDGAEPRIDELLRLNGSLVCNPRENFSGATLGHVEFIQKGNDLFAIRERARMANTLLVPGDEIIFDDRYKCNLSEKAPQGNYQVAALGDGYLQLPENLLKEHAAWSKKLLMTLPALFHLEALVMVPHMNWSKEERYSHVLTIAYLHAVTHEKACC